MAVDPVVGSRARLARRTDSTRGEQPSRSERIDGVDYSSAMRRIPPGLVVPIIPSPHVSPRHARPRRCDDAAMGIAKINFGRLLTAEADRGIDQFHPQFIATFELPCSCSHTKKRHRQQKRVLFVNAARASPGRVLGEKDNQNIEHRSHHDGHPAEQPDDPVPLDGLADDR
jgi:hypothetical protein